MKQLFLTLSLFISATTYSFEALSVADLLIDHCVHVSNEELNEHVQYYDGTEHISSERLAKVQAKFESRATSRAGGSEATTLSSLSQLGASSKLIGRTGNDLWGERYISMLQKEGVNVLSTKTDAATGQCFCIIDPSGTRSILTHLGASKQLAVNDIDPQHFQSIDLYYTSAYNIFKKETLLHTLELAKENNATIAMDLGAYNLVNNFRDDLLNIVEQYVDIIFANEEEASALTLIEDPEQAAVALSKMCDVAIVHMSERGGYVANTNTFFRYYAIPSTQTCDSTGAGDNFAAGFLYGYMKDLPYTEAALYGAVLGYAVTQTEGATLPHTLCQNLHAYVQQHKSVFKYTPIKLEDGVQTVVVSQE